MKTHANVEAHEGPLDQLLGQPNIQPADLLAAWPLL
jgi:hypothetical protein